MLCAQAEHGLELSEQQHLLPDLAAPAFTQSDSQRQASPLTLKPLLVYLSVLPCLLHTLDQLLFAPFAIVIAANSLSVFQSHPPTDGQLVLAFKRCQGRQGVVEACVGVCGMPDIWAAGKLLHQL